MATESPVRIGDGIRASSSSTTSSSSRDAVHELNLLVRDRSRLAGSSDLHLHRSESAPPTVEGSLAAMEELFGAQLGRLGGGGGGGGGGGHRQQLVHDDHLVDDDDDDTSLLDAKEQELRSDPAYYAYYHSHVNLNPRLPPPLKSWDNWRFANRTRLNRFRSLDDHHMSANNSSSLFSASSQHLLPTHKEEPEHLLDDTLEQLLLRHSSTSANDGGFGMGRPKSLVDLIQEDFPRTPSPVYNQSSRSSSRAANEDGSDPSAALEIQLGHLRDMSSVAVGSRSATPNPNNVHHMFSDVHDGADVRSSRSATPNPLSASKLSPDAPADPAPCSSSDSPTAAGISAAFKNLSVNQSDDLFDEQQQQHQASRSKQGSDQQSRAGIPAQAQAGYSHHQHHNQNQHHHHHQQQQQQSAYKFGQQTSPTSNAYAAAAAAAAMSYIAAGNPYYHNLQSASVYPPHYGLAGYPLLPHHPIMAAYPPAPPLAFDTMAAAMAARGGIPPDLHQYYKLTGQMPSTLQDALYLQYLRASEDARAATVLSDMRSYAGAHSPDGHDSHHQLFGGLNTKSQFSRGSVPVPAKAVPPVTPFYGSPPGLGFTVPFPNSPLPSPGLPSSPVGPSLRRDDHHRGSVRLTSANSGSRASAYAGWPTPASSDSGDEGRGSLLLEEFKNSKNRRFELSDIVGHVVEFSADQHGSRFIQQKLETASPEEKTMVFQEVFPHCVTLMTDVFGNYVIQKFFEHGTPQQRKELAEQLVTRVLTLSLQMYGCRVIQKALEVVDVEQQIQLVSELDGHVMRCVRDQNGNHVIQKCIECVPPDRIQFIISAFYGQVVALSTHPYGCRVIQRVLEHCTEEQKQQGIMQEILRSTCSLAQDQYGNYVVQHVLEHGTQPERSEIITKLAGQIVQMSQHKFASNVIEKCLEFGGPAERQILINEMLGLTDENEPLQAMMKDQFANYVVQKVLEICDDQQREILLTRIKVHLHALKKYTYGKHIVARVEKLVAAGERRSAVAAAHLACDK